MKDLRRSPKRQMHGLSKSPEHMAWRNMRYRCNNPSHFAYFRYGARGIRVCQEWENFMTFFRDMGHRPPGMSLERLDNNRGYSKENCVWASREEQNNNKSTNRFIYLYGERFTIGQLARKFSLNKTTLKDRLNAGWDVRDALLRPSLNPDGRSETELKIVEL